MLAQCVLYHNKREKARKNGTNVPDGMLKRLVLEEEEEKAGLTSNSVSLDIIRSRVKRGKLTAYNPTETPPPPLLRLNQSYVISVSN